MLFAIRINLVGTGKRRRRRAGMPDIPNIGVLLFVLVLVIEAAVLYSLHASASESANQVAQRLKKAKHDLELAKKVHGDIIKVKKELTTLETQTRLFDVLKAEKIGPVDALHYLSFILQPRDAAVWPREEQKLMEAAGWRVGWDARRAWFTAITQNRWKMKLQGQALAHEDVAEVQRRLESSPYFRNVKLVFQESKHDPELDDGFVDFTINAALVYLIKPWKWPPPSEPDPDEEAAKKAEGEDKDALPTLPSAIKAPRDVPSGHNEPTDTPGAATAGAAGAKASQPGAAIAAPATAATAAGAVEAGKAAPKAEDAEAKGVTP